jgi:hypothetical protein
MPHTAINDLPCIEADVVIVLTHPDGFLRTHPLWECGMSGPELIRLAARYALAFNEEMGTREVTAQIIDHRLSGTHTE